MRDESQRPEDHLSFASLPRVRMGVAVALSFGMSTYLVYYGDRHIDGVAQPTEWSLLLSSAVVIALLLAGMRNLTLLRAAAVLSACIILAHVIVRLVVDGVSAAFVVSNGAELVCAGLLWAMAVPLPEIRRSLL